MRHNLGYRLVHPFKEVTQHPHPVAMHRDHAVRIPVLRAPAVAGMMAPGEEKRARQRAEAVAVVQPAEELEGSEVHPVRIQSGPGGSGPEGGEDLRRRYCRFAVLEFPVRFLWLRGSGMFRLLGLWGVYADEEVNSVEVFTRCRSASSPATENVSGGCLSRGKLA